MCLSPRERFGYDTAAQWLKHYGEHLARVFEPARTLPSDFDRLVSAIAADTTQSDEWPDIY